MLFYKSYKYRLKPTKEQAAMIESAFSARRFIWNRFLERISKAAHEAIGFTYTPLEQLAVLQ